MALRQLRFVNRSMPSLVRYYVSSNVPTKSAPPGTMGNPTPEPSIDKLNPPIGKAYRSQGSSIVRTIRNIYKAGWKRAFWQIKEMNDTKVFPTRKWLIKVGTLIG